MDPSTKSDGRRPDRRSEAYFGLSVRTRRAVFVISLLFIAASFANPGGLLWNILVWIVAALLFLVLVAGLIRLLFPQSLRNWLGL